jgi:hypothetical protein
VPPESVEIYQQGQSIKWPSKVRWPFAKAQKAHKAGEGIFRDKRRAFVLFTAPEAEPSNSENSPSSLGTFDAEALAGLRPLSKERRERIAEAARNPLLPARRDGVEAWR